MMTKLANLCMQCQIGIGIKLASRIKLAIPVSRSILNLHPAADPRNRFLDVHATPTHHIYGKSSIPITHSRSIHSETMLHASPFNAQVASLPSGLLALPEASIARHVIEACVAGCGSGALRITARRRRTTPQDQLKTLVHWACWTVPPATDFEEASGAAQAAPGIPVQCVVSERARARNAQSIGTGQQNHLEEPGIRRPSASR
jgi:hypothetical protein